MSIGADSLMATVDMGKLLDKEILERGRVVAKKNGVNLQVADIVQAMASSEPSLFANYSATLMPVIVKEFKITVNDETKFE